MRFSANLVFANLNPRREKAGDGPGDLAADLKFTGEVKLQDMKDLFGTAHGHAVIEGLYDAEGNLRSSDFTSFRLASSFENYRATVAVGKQRMRFDAADFDKIVLEPKISRVVKVSARLQVHPTEEQFAQLAELLSSEVKLSLEEVQGSLFKSGDAGGEDPDPEEGDE